MEPSAKEVCETATKGARDSRGRTKATERTRTRTRSPTQPPLPTHSLTIKHSDGLSMLVQYCHLPPPCLPGHHRREGQSHWSPWRGGARRALVPGVVPRAVSNGSMIRFG
ncbi:hypothetical protein KC19_4G199600 [Ceratodon purpureus]|uniref:Uncharacterized protein n=1 Tax=Ceratodon purpureus TaxID=3225 RepID=A0A8T0ID77_CERPU|nr:hypothetical protein KC19_4G199600 [Ceratodon purpureus]